MDSTSAAFNLVIAAIGCGVLSFPFGFASAGLALGIAFALCFAAVNVWTLDILASACLAYTENAPYRTMVTSAPKKASRSLNRNLTTSSIAGSMPTLVVAAGGAPPVTVSYEILTGFHLGWRWRLLSEIAVGVGMIGSLIAFFVVISTLASQTFTSWLGAASIFSNRTFLTYVFAVCIALPLASLDDLHSLRFSSVLSIASVVAVFAVIVWRSAQCMLEHDNLYCAASSSGASHLPPFEWAQHSWTVMRALPLCVFSFGCHCQAVSAFFELDEHLRTRAAFARIAGAVATTCAVIYIGCGTFGYRLFGASVQGNVLLALSDDDVLALIAKISMAFHIVLASPVLIYPTRTMLRRFGTSIGKKVSRCCCTPATPLLDDEEDNGPARDADKSSPVGASSVSPLSSSVTSDFGAAAAAHSQPLLHSAAQDYENAAGLSDAPVSRLSCCAGRCSCAAANFAQAAVVVLASASIAVVAPQVQVVFGLMGATSGVIQVTLIPAVLLLHRPPEDGSSGSAQRAAAWALIALSVFVGVVGTALAFIYM